MRAAARCLICLALALSLLAAGCGTTPHGEAGPMEENVPPDEAGARVGVSFPIGD